MRVGDFGGQEITNGQNSPAPAEVRRASTRLHEMGRGATEVDARHKTQDARRTSIFSAASIFFWTLGRWDAGTHLDLFRPIVFVFFFF